MATSTELCTCEIKGVTVYQPCDEYARLEREVTFAYENGKPYRKLMNQMQEHARTQGDLRMARRLEQINGN